MRRGDGIGGREVEYEEGSGNRRLGGGIGISKLFLHLTKCPCINS